MAIPSDAILTLTPLQHSDTRVVAIVNDEVAEITESFKLRLNFSGEFDQMPFVKLNPSTATVTIIDDDESKVMVDDT